MKQKPRWTLEMLTASLALLCGVLVLTLLVQRPKAWGVLLTLVVLWGHCSVRVPLPAAPLGIQLDERHQL